MNKKHFMEEFKKIPTYSGRDYETISKEMEIEWKLNPLYCTKFALYARMVTIDEGLNRIYWLAVNQKLTFMNNIALILSAGSYQDIITLMIMDVDMNGWDNRKLDWIFLRSALATLPYEIKFPPIKTQHESISKVAKYLAIAFLGKPTEKDDYSSYTKYRKLRKTATVKDWHKLAEKQDLIQLDFSKLHGKAIATLCNPKYIASKNLAKEYEEYMSYRIKSRFNGSYINIFELLGNTHIPDNILPFIEAIIDRQFETAIHRAEKDDTISKSVLVVRDISSSMESSEFGVSPYNISKSAAIYYSKLNLGYFHNKYLVFTNNGCELRTFNGNTACEIWKHDTEIIYSENNTLEKVANYFSAIKGISENELPKEIIIFSDGDFSNTGIEDYNKFKELLSSYGYSDNYINNLYVSVIDITSIERPYIREENFSYTCILLKEESLWEKYVDIISNQLRIISKPFKFAKHHIDFSI